MIRIYKYKNIEKMRGEEVEIAKYTVGYIVEFCIKYENMIECRWVKFT